MINTKEYGAQLRQLGYTFYSGVPCSFLKNLINYAICEEHYVSAVNEGDAIASCFGASLTGTKSVVLMQNSGLGNAVSPLTSLNFCFDIPVLGFVSLRGDPGLSDEPQHELMGQITGQLLTDMRIDWDYLSADEVEAQQQLLAADAVIERGGSFFFIVKKGVFSDYALTAQPMPKSHNKVLENLATDEVAVTRASVLELLKATRTGQTAYLATTGVTGRELYQLAEAPNNLYMVGSMGCISSIGLGLALKQPALKVIAIDGDGALLMRMGNMATNGWYAPANLFHLLIDNNCHESTGGQATASPNVNFADIAAASGYPQAYKVDTLAQLQHILDQWHANPELTFVHMRVKPGILSPLGRPSETPSAIALRFKHFVNSVSNKS